VKDELHYTSTHTCLYNLLMVWKQPFYEKELSESIDERYLYNKNYCITFFCTPSEPNRMEFFSFVSVSDTYTNSFPYSTLENFRCSQPGWNFTQPPPYPSLSRQSCLKFSLDQQVRHRNFGAASY
jgi:hypothetical protein